MYRNIFSILLVVLIGSNKMFAQDRAFSNMFTFAWDVNIPMGDKFVDATSFAGGKIEYRKMVSNNWSIGGDLSWNSFYDYHPYQTYHVNNSTDVTTDLYTYNYTLPLSITAHYYFPIHSALFVPYAGIGLGATYSNPKIYFNIYEITGDNWGFLMRPEIGTLIKFERDADMGLLVGVRYSYSTNQEDVFKIKNLQSLGFQLGLAWSY
jgi:hypothetical protein